MTVPEFDRFDRLDELTSDLAQMRLELGELLAAERVQRVRAFADSGADSVSAADRYADEVSLDLAESIIKLKAEIAAAEVAWEFLLEWMGTEV